jgi:hypothetical protein
MLYFGAPGLQSRRRDSRSADIYLTFRYGSTTGEVFRNILRPALLAVALFFAVCSTAYVISLTLTSAADVAALVALSPSSLRC